MDKKDIRFRASIARGIKGEKSGVDREFKHDKGHGAIFGYAVISKGPLNDGDSRDWENDDKSLSQVIDLGNAAKMGVKARFGHPNMSSDALGTFLGRSKNFRLDGDVVRADLMIDETAYKTPDGDLALYILDLAENDPAAFGTSLVFSAELETRLNEDGTAKKDDKGNPLPRLVRFTKLFASDVVDDPAANKGLFGKFFSGSVMPSASMTTFLDKFLTMPDAVEKTIAFLKRYQSNDDEMGSEEKETDTMDIKDLTVEILSKDRPDILEALAAQTKTAVSDAVAEAVRLERERSVGILALALAFGKHFDVASESIKAGDAITAADSKFKAKELAAIKEAAPASPGPGNPEQEDLSQLSLEDRCAKEFEKSADLRAEFGKLETYIAFTRAEKSGRAKIWAQKKK